MRPSYAFLLATPHFISTLANPNDDVYAGKYVGPNFTAPAVLSKLLPPPDWTPTETLTVLAHPPTTPLSKRDYTYGNAAVHERVGWCTMASTLGISSFIARTLVKVVINTSILEGGIPYELTIAPFTISLTREDFAPTDPALLIAALSDMRDLLVSSTDGNFVYEHASAAIGGSDAWQAGMAVGYSLWISINGHTLKERDGDDVVVAGKRTLGKRDSYNDECFAWTTSDPDFGQTGSFQGASCVTGDTQGAISCQFCCNGCDRSGTDCCPPGYNC